MTHFDFKGDESFQCTQCMVVTAVEEINCFKGLDKTGTEVGRCTARSLFTISAQSFLLIFHKLYTALKNDLNKSLKS